MEDKNDTQWTEEQIKCWINENASPFRTNLLPEFIENEDFKKTGTYILEEHKKKRRTAKSCEDGE